MKYFLENPVSMPNCLLSFLLLQNLGVGGPLLRVRKQQYVTNGGNYVKKMARKIALSWIIKKLRVPFRFWI